MLNRFLAWLMPAPCDDPACTRYRKSRPTCRNGHPQVYALGERGPPTTPRPKLDGSDGLYRMTERLTPTDAEKELWRATESKGPRRPKT